LQASAKKCGESAELAREAAERASSDALVSAGEAAEAAGREGGSAVVGVRPSDKAKIDAVEAQACFFFFKVDAGDMYIYINVCIYRYM
jgi:hypothetical protein